MPFFFETARTSNQNIEVHLNQDDKNNKVSPKEKKVLTGKGLPKCRRKSWREINGRWWNACKYININGTDCREETLNSIDCYIERMPKCWSTQKAIHFRKENQCTVPFPRHWRQQLAARQDRQQRPSNAKKTIPIFGWILNQSYLIPFFLKHIKSSTDNTRVLQILFSLM